MAEKWIPHCDHCEGSHTTTEHEDDERSMVHHSVVDINYRIVALDPGGTTGWATYSALWRPGTNKPYSYEKWDCGHMGPEPHHEQLNIWLGMQRVQNYTVVCERFDDRQTGHKVDLIAGEYIGVVKKYCYEEEVDLVMQMPGVAKPFTKNDNLKKLGLWQGTKWKHAMDAERHLLWYMINGEPHRHDLLEMGWPNR
jgi:hypothetical protein